MAREEYHRREFLKGAGTAAVLATTAGCTGGDGNGGGSPTEPGTTEEPTEVTPTPTPSALDKAKEEGDITFYSAIDQPDIDEYFVPALKDEFPWLDVTMPGLGAGEIISKVLSEQEANQVTGDMVTIGEGIQNIFKSEDILREIPPRIRQKARDIGYPDHTISKYKLPSYSLISALLVNTEQTSMSEAPSKWEDLADDKWEGEIVFQHPAVFGPTGGLFASLWGKWGEEKWRNVMSQVAENSRIIQSNSEAFRILTQGEASLSVNFLIDLVGAVTESENPPPLDVKWLPPTVVVDNQLTLIKGTDSPHVQEAIASWWVEKEGGQQVIADSGRPAAQPEVLKNHPKFSQFIPEDLTLREAAYNNPKYQGTPYRGNQDAWAPLFNEIFGKV